MKENALDKQSEIQEVKALKKLRLILFHISGAGITLVFASLIAIAEIEIPKIVITALTVGVALMSAVLILRLIILFTFKNKGI